MKCIFCQIIAGDINSYKVYEDVLVYAFLDIHPILKGHTLIIPKKHSVDIRDIDEDSLTQVIKVSKKLVTLYQEKLGAVGFNIRNNNGSVAHQDVFHFHLHLVPRYQDDGINLRADIRDSSADLGEIQQILNS